MERILGERLFNKVRGLVCISLGVLKTVQHMPTQSRLNRHMRVVELACEPHTQSLHDGTRFQIVDVGECNDLSKAEVLKAECDG